mgnify:CR=1 FL=1
MPYASLVIIFNKDNKVLLLKRSKKVDSYPEYWGFPGGKREDGETSVEAAVREVREETSLTVYPKELAYVFTMKRGEHKDIVFYITKKWSGTPSIDWESDEFRWVDPKDMSQLNMVPTPKLVYDLIDAWSKVF